MDLRTDRYSALLELERSRSEAAEAKAQVRDKVVGWWQIFSRQGFAPIIGLTVSAVMDGTMRGV